MKYKNIRYFSYNKGTIKDNSPAFIIAEIGINHNGDVNIARELIKAAKEAGANAVKFQKRTVETVYTQEYLVQFRQSPFGNKQRDLKEALELKYSEYTKLKTLADNLELEFIITPWDENSVDTAVSLGCSFIKIGSPCLHDANLIRYISKTGIPTIISTGMSDEEQILNALKILNTSNVALMYCISSYPTPIENANLSTILWLKERFPTLCIGYSGHEVGWLPTLIAVAFGAKLVERHITLDKTMWGSDQKISLTPQEFQSMIVDIRNVERAIGNPKNSVLEIEIPAMLKLQRKRLINWVIIDVDGVITDGNLYYVQSKSTFKRINYRNLDAINNLMQKGYYVGLLSKDNSDLSKKIIERIPANVRLYGCADKYDSLKIIARDHEISVNSIFYVGDSFPNIPVFHNINYSCCPADAIPQIKRVAKIILQSSAIDGCLPEVVQIVEDINQGLRDY